MKLKTYILSMVAVSMLFACSDNNDPIDPTKPNATLSLLTDASSLRTKADDGISTLGVAIVYGNGQIMTGFTSSPTNGTEILKTPVKGGSAQVVVFANLDATTVGSFTTPSGGSVENILNTLWTLDKEVDGKFSMSSKVYSDIILAPGTENAMGYGSTPGNGRVSVFNDVVKLYRNVSRVQVTGISLQEDTRYGKAQYFKLNSIFMANVKSQTKVGAEEAWGKVEVIPFDTPANWWYGAVTGETGTYKGIVGGSEKVSLLKYTPSSTVQLGKWDGGPDMFLSDWVPTSNPSFHVYENQTASKDSMTYLIICGDYTLLENGQKVEYKNRYWAVAINPSGTDNTTDYSAAGITDATKTELLAHKGIRRNHIYSLLLTLTGRGSDKPYTPDATINLNAEVVVNPWSKLVDVPGGVE